MDETKYLEHLYYLWKKNWPAELPKEINYPLGKMVVAEYLHKRAELTPNKTCIIYYGTEITFGVLDDLSNRFASFLADQGLQKGDRVAVFMSNCPQFFIAFYGILKLGCVHVPVNPMFKERELIYELQDTGAKVIVTTDQLNPLVQGVKEQTSILEIITTSLTEYLPENPSLPVHPMYLESKKVCPGTTDMLSMLESQSPNYPEVEVSLDDIAALNYTGGTTGMPKGCAHTHWNMLYTSASACTYIFRIIPEEVGLVYWPSFWIAGEVLGLLNPIVSGATHVLFGRWDPEAVLQAIEKYKVTFINGGMDDFVTLMGVLNVDKYDLTSIKITTAASLSKRLDLNYRKRWKELTGCNMVEPTWGMTETQSYDTYTSFMQVDDMDLKGRPSFVGLPAPGTQFKVTGFEKGELLPLGEEGELMVRSPSILKSYWNNPEATEKAFDDGWFHTGDIGMINEEGYIYFLGRNKEMLKVKGMSVFPSEVELILSRHPAVEANAIVGKPDEKKGEIPVAFVLLKEEYASEISEKEFEDWCKMNMATYKVPVVKIVDELPMTTTDKINKVELEKRLPSYFS